jgi:hypothetical protein
MQVKDKFVKFVKSVKKSVSYKFIGIKGAKIFSFPKTHLYILLCP